jgi:hypothetical protein
MVGLNFVARWRLTAGVKGPFFDVPKGWDIIPSGEVVSLVSVVTSCGDPPTTQDTFLVAVDVACAGDALFRGVLEVWIDWELFTALLLSDWSVTERSGKKDLFGLKSHLKASRVN